MRIYGWGVFAVTLLIYGVAGNETQNARQLLHVEVLPVMAPGGCSITAGIAELYLVPAIDGADSVAYVCHTGLRDSELQAMQREAAAGNASRKETGLDP